MRLPYVILLFVFLCAGCERDSVPAPASGTSNVPPTPPERAAKYPQVQWSEPVSEASNVVDANSTAWPANMAAVRRHFNERDWRKATTPEFVVLLSQNDFFKITIPPDTTEMVGTVKSTRTFEHGPMRGELLPRIRMTEPLTGEEEVLSLFDAYLRQDGTFDALVRWTDDETDPSNSEATERSP